MQASQGGESKSSDGNGAYQRLLRTCGKCGVEYDATAQALMERRAGMDRRFLCPPCKQVEVNDFEVAQAEAKAVSLAYMRDDLRSQQIPPKYLKERLDTFDPDRGGNHEKVVHIEKWLKGFPDGYPRGAQSLFICSLNRGVGKTHLACGIIHALVDRLNEHRERCPYRFVDAAILAPRWKAAQSYGARERVEDIMSDIGDCWLLVLDDVGNEGMSRGDEGLLQGMYFALINHRYNRELPVIVTANLPFDEPWTEGGATLVNLMGAASVSRLREMSGGVAVEILGEDQRGR
ncbi:MAG: ATP-binding protein [Chloroflexi bacterium]|nr:ATP-binding protein [Chloroflexota bacterium]